MPQKLPDIRYIEPDRVVYGRPGKKATTLNHDRPGNNFMPFIDLVLRASCSIAGIPL
jgi:hypothetical protein